MHCYCYFQSRKHLYLVLHHPRGRALLSVSVWLCVCLSVCVCVCWGVCVCFGVCAPCVCACLCVFVCAPMCVRMCVDKPCLLTFGRLLHVVGDVPYAREAIDRQGPLLIKS